MHSRSIAMLPGRAPGHGRLLSLTVRSIAPQSHAKGNPCTTLAYPILLDSVAYSHRRAMVTGKEES
jgi:hypothetical protein